MLCATESLLGARAPIREEAVSLEIAQKKTGSGRAATEASRLLASPALSECWLAEHPFHTPTPTLSHSRHFTPLGKTSAPRRFGIEYEGFFAAKRLQHAGL